MTEPYFTLLRRILETDLWLEQKFTRGQAWVDMIGNAAHAPTYVRIRGIKVPLQRGQLALSEVEYAKRWQWSRGKVRRFLAEREKAGKIEQQKTNVTTVVSLLNYDEYQRPSEPNGTANRTANGTANGHIQEPKNLRTETPIGAGEEPALPGFEGITPPAPANGGKHSKADLQTMRVSGNTKAMARIGAIVGRKPTTLWNLAEAQLLNLLGVPPDDEMEVVYKWHRMKWPDWAGKDYRRRALETVLRHWNSEVDRANEWFKKNGGRLRNEGKGKHW